MAEGNESRWWRSRKSPYKTSISGTLFSSRRYCFCGRAFAMLLADVSEERRVPAFSLMERHFNWSLPWAR
ncbi:hypothetical protein cyc_03132 [Cyclospora cayetanensis]|uniref:Uncharacterized protein n=1 Tax=Cyclospora cayetanensis TaxID=88456 RepID=A0A1D3CYW8_9EIME|nr:hypothetical protein cyc_03132 [Cyclospora cayetanensis]